MKLATVFGDLAGSSSTTMSPIDVASLTFWASAEPLAKIAVTATIAARKRDRDDCIVGSLGGGCEKVQRRGFDAVERDADGAAGMSGGSAGRAVESGVVSWRTSASFFGSVVLAGSSRSAFAYACAASSAWTSPRF